MTLSIATHSYSGIIHKRKYFSMYKYDCVLPCIFRMNWQLFIKQGTIITLLENDQSSCFWTSQLTNCIELGLYWETDGGLASLFFYRKRKSITVVTNLCDLLLSLKICDLLLSLKLCDLLLSLNLCDLLLYLNLCGLLLSLNQINPVLDLPIHFININLNIIPHSHLIQILKVSRPLSVFRSSSCMDFTSFKFRVS